MTTDNASVWEPGSIPLIPAGGAIKSQVFTASASQSVFNLTLFTYTPATESIIVFKNGLVLQLGVDYTETDSDTITLVAPVTAGTKIMIIGFVGITGTVGIPSNGSVTFASLAFGFAITNTELPVVDMAHGGLGASFASLAAIKTYLGIEAAASQITQEGILNVITPNFSGKGMKDIVLGGWFPSFMNQDWGGGAAPYWWIDEATGNEYKFTSATANIDGFGIQAAGSLAANVSISQGFILSQALAGETLDVWVKIYKIGNPVNGNLNIYADSAGQPTGAVLFTAPLPLSNVITTSIDGEWYRVSIPAVTLSANVRYHLAVTNGTVDAANYLVSIADTGAKAYPFGNMNIATAAPVWTATVTSALVFIISLPEARQLLQSGGLFNGRLVFNEGTPINQSNCLCNNAYNVWDGEEATWIFSGASWAASKPFFDIIYGIDNNRITSAVDINGNVTFSVYDYLGTLKTTSSLGVDVRTGNHQIVLSLRAKNDGIDYMKIFIDGVQNGLGLTNDSILFDNKTQEIGTCWLGGGFASSPAWTQKLSMNTLPSADAPAWTFTGIATEASAFKIDNSRMYQNKSGYTALQTGYYQRAGVALSNANGWAVAWRARVSDATNLPFSQASMVNIFDGAKQTSYMMQDYFISYSSDLATVLGHNQLDNNKKYENQFLVTAKATDQFLFVNGKFTRDGTGTLLTASASNQIQFGDNNAVSGENQSVVWESLSFYNTANYLPAVSSGLQLSEFVALRGSQTNYITNFYNGGAPKSVKDFAGIDGGYIDKQIHKQQRRGVTINGTSASITDVTIPEMSVFALGKDIEVKYSGSLSNNAAQFNLVSAYVDGETNNTLQRSVYTAATITAVSTFLSRVKRLFGLHRVAIRAKSATGTITHTLTNREINVEGDC